MDLTPKDWARSMLISHAASGVPMSISARDRLVASAEIDEEFREVLAGHARARDAREEHVRRSNAEFVRMLRAAGFR